jgi:lysozyme
MVIAAIGGVGYLTYAQGMWRFNNPSLVEYPAQGLDVSHHQGVIDWAAVPKERVKFVYIKATEGGDHKDKKFIDNWNGARAQGFKAGAYHFFTLCKPGLEQAKNFESVVSFAHDDLPPVIDLEFVGNCAARPSRTEFLNELQHYARRIESISGQKPVLYTTYEFYKAYLKGSDFESYPFWVRDVFKKPDPKIFRRWVIWQYADNALVRGIDTPVDMNAAAPGFGEF